MLEKDFLLLKIVRMMGGFYKRIGVDLEQLLWILRLKLTLDSRKQTLQEAMGNKSKMDGSKQNLIVMGFVGIFSGMLMPMPLDLYYKVAVLAGMNLFFLVMYMVSDFSSVLLDVRDSTVIMTKPVDPRTMNAARITHIAYYMLSMFMALNAVPLVLGTFKHGAWFILGMLLMMFLMSFLIIFFTTILYSLLLRFFDGERLKDVLNFLQVILAIITVIAYQVLARMFEFVDMNLTINIKWWSYLLPPTWFAGLFKVLVEQDYSVSYLVMSILALVMPVVFGLALKIFILPKYETYLTKLSIEGTLIFKRKSVLGKIKEGLMRVLSKDHVEFAFMKFTDSNLTRDRKLKLMIYPNHALGLIFPFLMLFNTFRGREFSEGLASMKGSMNYLILYLVTMFLMTNFDFLKYSSNASAAFIFDSFPVKNKAIFYRAALKTYYLKFIFPSMVIMSALFMGLFGFESISGILLINAVTVLVMLLRGFIVGVFMPFSLETGTTGNKNLGSLFLMMVVMGGIAGIHFAVAKYMPIATLPLLVCVLLLCKLFSFGLLKKKVSV